MNDIIEHLNNVYEFKKAHFKQLLLSYNIAIEFLCVGGLVMNNKGYTLNFK